MTLTFTYAKKLNTELSHLELKENEIFVLELYLHADFFYLCDTIYSEPFNSFDKVIEHIHNETLPVNSDWCWYKLSKWSLNDEKNKYIIEYYISTEGEVFFSDYYKKFEYQVFFPLPFNVGDIICFDSLPFTNEMLGIILVADNHIDRIHIKCLYFDFDGNIYVESLEDFSVWRYHAYKISLPSPLYRIQSFDGELTDYDKNLLTIKEILTKDKNASQKICDFVSEYNRDKKFSDLKWETLYSGVINTLNNN